ncbi:hypothetical protein TcasGA2_TC009764 [Tribolium castaneum]|uniref:Uncharacterized protein n=1 Tax=Tribolium castaneum TaxID=7070 RepID=D6WPK3_TRICA|nr:hypothetical protein TcasGA2_TC009764 [Tribolium castaneum]
MARIRVDNRQSYVTAEHNSAEGPSLKIPGEKAQNQMQKRMVICMNSKLAMIRDLFARLDLFNRYKAQNMCNTTDFYSIRNAMFQSENSRFCDCRSQYIFLNLLKTRIEINIHSVGVFSMKIAETSFSTPILQVYSLCNMGDYPSAIR